MAKWLDEDVRYIITHQERIDFGKLITDEQRDEFVEEFWQPRNPTPGSPQNAFKEEHDRRMAYANTHFAEGLAGYRTDRGRFYIVYGAPDRIEHHPRSESSDDKNGADRFECEEWHYPNLEGLGKDVAVEFVDTCAWGEYHLTRDPFDKNSPTARA